MPKTTMIVYGSASEFKQLGEKPIPFNADAVRRANPKYWKGEIEGGATHVCFLGDYPRIAKVYQKADKEIIDLPNGFLASSASTVVSKPPEPDPIAQEANKEEPRPGSPAAAVKARDRGKGQG